jgi:hypothetical protein
MSADASLREIAQGLLARAGVAGDFEMSPLPGGRNNRVWRLQAGESDFLFKQYYWTENDRRDRMGHEWDFLGYLHSIGAAAAAKAIAADPENRCALLEFIRGVQPAFEEISEQDLLAAADFFSEMNAGRFSDAGRALQPASEACFSLAAHAATAARRVERLDRIEPAGPEHRAAMGFVTETLRPLWQNVRARILDGASECGGMDRELAAGERCLSPSDFGFHNSLREAGGRLRFVDFEYSGWDDPAKTIADFANQPDMLLDARLSGLFRDRALALFAGGSLESRLRLLTPLYQVKWACICLNEFLQSGSDRRAFTGLKTDEGPTRLGGHLDRARIMAGRAAKSLDISPPKRSVPPKLGQPL